MPIYNHYDPLYGIQIVELEKFLPFLTTENRNDFIQQKNNINFCVLCNKNCTRKHINTKKHKFNICKLNAIKKANIQQFLSRNKNYIDVSSRNNISISPITIHNDIKDINSSFLCPISMEIMKEPVVAGDGYTYDKTSIQKWFKTKDTSPITNLKIDTIITPNITLHTIIQESL